MEQERKLEELCEELARFRLKSIGYVLASYSHKVRYEDAEDIVSRATFNAYRALKSNQFRGESSLDTWFRRILMNSTFMFLRAGKNKHFVDIDDFENVDHTPISLVKPSVEGELISEEKSKRVRRALGSVSNYGGREVLFLHHYQGLSVREIGEMIGVGKECVKIRLLRARREITKNIKKEDMEARKYMAKGAGA